MSTPHLFSPLQIRNVTFRNRIGVSPMCMYSCENMDGVPNNWHLVHLGARAVGGAGLVMTEATSVSPEGRISPQDLGIWNDRQAEALAPIAEFIKQHGAVPGIQLAHAGRKAGTFRPWGGGSGWVPEAQGGWTPIGPSALAFQEGAPIPQELSIGEIQRIVSDFVAAAQRALQAGFQVIEIHAAHGYLLHEFLSAISNQRTDDYGGDFAGRTRILIELVNAVRNVWPASLPIFLRVSATDWVEGGWTGDDTVELAKMVGPLGIDLVDCSSGGNLPKADIPVGPGYQVSFASRVRNEAGVLTAAVGLITDSQQADKIVSDGQADFVLLAREMLRDPHWPLRAARELGREVKWPDQYARAAL